MSVPNFKSLIEEAKERYLAGDLLGADRAFQEWITGRRAEYERAKIDFNEGCCPFHTLEAVRIALELAETAFRNFHDLVEILEKETNAERTETETRH